MTEKTEVKESQEELLEYIRKQYGTMYYDRQGKEMTLIEWSRMCEDSNYKILKQEEVDRYFVSTVWIGLNMQLFRMSPIQIFETMIFLKDEENKDENDPFHLYVQRYSTEEEAFLGHIAVINMIRNQSKELESQVVENEKDSQSEDLDLSL